MDPKEQAEEQEVIEKPADEKDEPAKEVASKEEVSAEDRTRQLEIELAEARGRLSELKKEPTPAATTVSTEEQQYQNGKQVVFSDMGTMAEEDFSKKYGMDKNAVRNHYSEYDRRLSEQKTNEKLAKIEAENEILTKYGSSYGKFKGEVAAALEDASPDVRRDPVRLAKFMERTFLALSRDEKQVTAEKKTSKEGADVKRRIIGSDFETPTSASEGHKRKKEEQDDELTGEELAVGRHFGITTKSERKKYEGRYLEMNFGNGVRFSDPAKGFEKVQKK